MHCPALQVREELAELQCCSCWCLIPTSVLFSVSRAEVCDRVYAVFAIVCDLAFALTNGEGCCAIALALVSSSQIVSYLNQQLKTPIRGCWGRPARLGKKLN